MSKGDSPRSGTVPRLEYLLAAAGLAAVLLFPREVVMAAPRGEPAKSLAELDEEYSLARKDLLRRCAIDGHAELGVIIDAWKLPVVEGRQLAFAIPATLETPACVDTHA